MRGLWWIPATLGVAGVVALLDSDSGIRRWHQLGVEVEVAHERIRKLEEDLAQLREEARLLVRDDFAIERAIREDLLYAKRDETLLQLGPLPSVGQGR